MVPARKYFSAYERKVLHDVKRPGDRDRIGFSAEQLAIANYNTKEKRNLLVVMEEQGRIVLRELSPELASRLEARRCRLLEDVDSGRAEIATLIAFEDRYSEGLLEGDGRVRLAPLAQLQLDWSPDERPPPIVTVALRTHLELWSLRFRQEMLISVRKLGIDPLHESEIG